MTLRTKGDESTNEPPCPTFIHYHALQTVKGVARRRFQSFHWTTTENFAIIFFGGFEPETPTNTAPMQTVFDITRALEVRKAQITIWQKINGVEELTMKTTAWYLP